MNIEEILITCGCHAPEHNLQFTYDTEDNELYIYLHLTNYNFLSRLWRGLKYIVGVPSAYGHFEEHIFNNNNCDKMLDLFGRIKMQEVLKTERVAK